MDVKKLFYTRLQISAFVMSMLVMWPAFSSNTLDIVVKDTSEMPLNKKVFGVHGEMLWSPVRYEDSLLPELYNDLGFTGIRFPGGTTSNYYMWETGDFGCKKSIPDSARSKGRVVEFNSGLKVKGRSYTTDDFVTFIKNTKTDFTLVLNIFCNSNKSNLDWLKKFKDEGINVQTIELGNELYYKEYYWVFPNPEDYVIAASMMSKEIKKIYPNAKVGFVGSSSVFRSSYYPDITRMNKSEHYAYGMELDKKSSQSEWSDATVVHIYSTPGLSKLEQFIGAVDNEKIYRNAMSHFDSRLNKTIDYFIGLNPVNEIWITEWGVLFYDDTLKYERDFQSSLYNALFLVNGMLTFEMNSDVDMAYVHNLPHYLPNKDGEVKAVISKRALQLLRQSLSKSNKISYVDIDGMKVRGSTHNDFHGESAEITSLLMSGGSESYLIMVNKYDTDYEIRSLAFESGSKIEVVRIDQLMPNNGANVGTDGVYENVVLMPKELGINSNILLPGYSITVIVIKQT